MRGRSILNRCRTHPAVGVGGKCLLGGRIRHLQHPPWRLAGCAHPSWCNHDEALAPLYRRTKMTSFLQSTLKQW